MSKSFKFSIVPFTGKAKNSGKEFHCYKLAIGHWEQLVFPKSQFEDDYIRPLIGKGLEATYDDDAEE